MANAHTIMHAARRIGAMLLLASLLGACASYRGVPHALAPLHGVTVPTVEMPAFGRVTPEMKSFLDRHVAPAAEGGREKLAWTLVWAATDRNVLDFDYDPGVTLTPEETFAHRTGNCLSFSLMFVAMARHLGLDAWYQEVEVPPQWNSANNTLLVSMHINVVVEGARGAWVVDVSGEGGTPTRHQRRLRDVEAHAQYLNNLGAEALTANELGRAFAHFVKAIGIAPDLSYVWSNLGVVYNRNGQPDAAREAHRTALRIDPGNAVAANNLYLIYEQEGDLASARELRARVEKHRRKNPYYLYQLSSQALADGRLADSLGLLEQAIALNGREYRFHYERARTLARAGDLDAARASLDRALELAPRDVLAGDLTLDHLPELPE